jgi:multiple sugar transport system ATP-binding protein
MTPAVVLGSQRLTLPAPVAARVAAYQGRKIIVGVRPEDLAVSGSASGGGSASGASAASGGGSASGGALVADVRLVEVLGSEQHVYFSVDATPAADTGSGAAAAVDESAAADILAGSAPNGVARVDPRSAAAAAVRAGARVTFTVDPARLHFFDPDTGDAIG